MARHAVNSNGVLVLDSEGLVKLGAGDHRVRAFFETARERGARVVVSAIALTEVLQGGPRDTGVHRVLSRTVVLPVSAELGGQAEGSTYWFTFDRTIGAGDSDCDRVSFTYDAAFGLPIGVH